MQLSSPHFDAVGEAEAPLEAPRRDTAVEIIARTVLGLLAAYDQLAALDGDGKLIDATASVMRSVLRAPSPSGRSSTLYGG